MKYINFADNDDITIALLIKDSAFSKQLIEQHYIKDITNSIAISVPYNESNKAPVKLIKEYLENIMPSLDKLGVTTLLVADANYFKVLTKKRKAEPELGYVVPCALKGYEHINVILSINYQALFHNPDNKSKLELSLNTLTNHINGTSKVLGKDIIQFEQYPTAIEDISKWLYKLHQYDILTCDIETYSLRFNEARIASISFAWNQHEGIAFKGEEVYSFLRNFFENYKGTLIFHNATFDIKVIIYELFMEHDLDYEGLLNGLDIMYRNIHDTKIIAYLATNSTAGNKLSLKDLAFEYAGNYAQENIKDITLIPEDELLKYNLIDTLATWFVFNTYYSKMVNDNQLDIYNNLLIPSLKVITHMELIGMSLDMTKVLETEKELHKIQQRYIKVLRTSQLVKKYEWILQRTNWEEANSKLKKKIRNISEFNTLLNPRSGKQLQGLLYDYLGLDIIETTDTGLPATDKDTLQKLYNQIINKYEIGEAEL